MADPAEKRAADSKSLVDKEALKADTEDNFVELGRNTSPLSRNSWPLATRSHFEWRLART